MKRMRSGRIKDDPVRKRSVPKINNKGFTLIELIVVLAIMGIMGGMLVSMIHTGAITYRSTYDMADAQNDARVAMSYLTVKIRQNDARPNDGTDGIKVIVSDTGSFQALQIKDSQNTGFSFWIYCADGKLRQQYAADVAGFDGAHLDSSGMEIANISDLDVQKEEAKITLRVKSSDNSVNLTQIVTLRSSLTP
ncbi:DUF4860 domain-containing protein [Desulfitobacterium sp.]|uniref:DUF4860 domain-containing protein n=1 Tax=Desulfitobacterium sp. TaxID=49981 RepID=UPI002B21F5E7|nr:DUF4860 domain-containing protein [Desulfitobacterium sp.]MEA4901304.1 DUF4860 domain-containing protein [Desulfitobacterium sp.]